MILNNNNSLNIEYKRFNFTPNISIVFARIKGNGFFTFPVEEHKDFFELDITPRSDIQIDINGKKIQVNHGELILIPPGAKHSASFVIKEVYNGASLFINKEILNIKMSSESLVVQDKDRRIEKLFHLIVNDLDIHNCQSDDFINEIIRLMCNELRKSIFHYQVPNIYIKIKNHLHENYPHKISIKTVAQIYGIEEHLLIKKFKKYFGSTPVSYLKDFRLKKTIELINMNNGMSISEIAFSVGFNDISTFNRYFKKKYHCTPKQYKKR